MILTGINFSSKYTYISICNPKDKEQTFLTFGKGFGLRNSIYYKNQSPLTIQEILLEEKIELQNYIPNLQNFLKALYKEEQFVCENPSVKIERDLENGFQLTFKEETGKEFQMSFSEILCDFFLYIIGKIRTEAQNLFGIVGEINTVISCSDDYSEDQILELQRTAIKAGIMNCKIIQEVLSSCLGHNTLKNINLTTSYDFLVCNFGTDKFQIFLMKFSENQFKIIASEKNTEIKANDIDQQVFEMIIANYEENYPSEVTFKDLIILESMAQTVKYHFGNLKNLDDDVSEIVGSFISNKSNEESPENFWHAVYKEVDLYFDEETFEDIICEPLVEKIQHTCQKFFQNIQKFQSQPNNIIFTGSLANIPKLRQTITDFFNLRSIQEENFALAFVRGAGYWCEKSFSLDPNPKLNKFIDADVQPNLIHSIGIQVKIPYFNDSINKMIINQGTYVPLAQPIFVQLIIPPEQKQIQVLEGEGILPMETKQLLLIDLTELLQNQEKPEKISMNIFIDANYILKFDIQWMEKTITKKFKYIPAKNLMRKNSFSIFKTNQNLMKMKLRALIAEKIFSFESYYQNLFSKNLKKKYQTKMIELEKFKCFIGNDLFEIKKLESVITEINSLLDFQLIFFD